MERKSVTSGNISSVGYDPDSGLLQVEFKNGGVYDYEGVSSDDYDGFMKANDDPKVSTGSYFHENIKSKYSGKRK